MYELVQKKIQYAEHGYYPPLDKNGEPVTTEPMVEGIAQYFREASRVAVPTIDEFDEGGEL